MMPPRFLWTLMAIAINVDHWGYMESDPPPGVATSWLVKKSDGVGYEYRDVRLAAVG